MTWALAEAREHGHPSVAEGLDDPLTVDGDADRGSSRSPGTCSATRSSSARPAARSRSRLRAAATARRCFEVSDTGRGISAEFLPHVFEMFQQADSATTRDEGGLGIGLALVKSLIELHGGRVERRFGGEGRGRDVSRLAAAAPEQRLRRARSRATAPEPSRPRRPARAARRRHGGHARDLRLPARARRLPVTLRGERATRRLALTEQRGFRPADLRRRHARNGRLRADRRSCGSAHRTAAPAGDRAHRATAGRRTSKRALPPASRRTSTSRSTSNT